MSISIPHEEAHKHPEMGFLRKYIFSTDHKIIGIRLQLGWPHADHSWLGRLLKWPASYGEHMPPEFYNMLFSMHATIMIFFVIIPLLAGAFGNFTIPLMIGAPDMAFPKLNMLSYWFMWPAFLILSASFFVDGGAAGTGWTSYPTLASATMPAGDGFQSPAAPNSGLGQIM